MRSAARADRRPQGGQGLIEYAIIISLIALLVMGLLQAVGKATASAFCKVSNGLAGGGPVYGAGNNNGGVLGLGTLGGSYSNPQEVPDLCGSSMASGRGQTLVLANDGTLYIWGYNNGYGELGPNGPAGNDPAPTKVPIPGNVSAIGTGLSFSAVLTTDGSVYVWGANSSGEQGNGTADVAAHPNPAKVPGLPAIASLSVGQSDIYATTSSGTIYEWGDNGAAELGLGSQVSVGGAPAGCSCAWRPQTLALASVKSLVATDTQSVYALMTNGTVEAWGQNSHGQLGNNNPGVDATTPALVQAVGCGSSLQNIAQIAPGMSFALALDTAGNVYAWGLNSPNLPWEPYGGELGDNSIVDKPCPVRPQGLGGVGTYLGGVSLIGASSDGSYAEVGGSGPMYTWGVDGNGELGYVSGTNNQTTPKLATSYPSGVLRIGGGYLFTIAVYPPTSS